jgi:MFS family permease
MVPLEQEFGWSRSVISGAIAVNIALFGLIGPFAASLMQRFGLRRIVATALALLACAVALSTQMKLQWHLMLLWGILTGAGTGVMSLVLAAVVVNRWFEARRGLVLGALSAANATGQMLFLPFLARLIELSGWRAAALATAGAAAVLSAVVMLFMRNWPADVKAEPYGWKPDLPVDTRPRLAALPALAWAAKHRTFWILAGSFFVCGASTNGLIGTHLIPACHDYGISEVHAAGLLALMGVFDIIGTTASGWLTDRFPSRNLLFVYYAIRGLSLLFLPGLLARGGDSLTWFAFFYGLDWVATVPPTVRLATEAFGRENAGVVFGWVGAAHQLGAASAALAAGTIRTEAGDYRLAFLASGALCFATAFVFLVRSRQVLVPATVN